MKQKSLQFYSQRFAIKRTLQERLENLKRTFGVIEDLNRLLLIGKIKQFDGSYETLYFSLVCALYLFIIIYQYLYDYILLTSFLVSLNSFLLLPLIIFLSL